jgi:hypothetical protein
MLVEKITNEELEFMEGWHTPPCLIESLFSNFDNLSDFREDEFGELRLYQLPMLSYEPIIDEKVENLTEKQRFELRKNVGDIYNFGARKYGKTLCTEKLDVPISMLHDDGFPCGFASTDAIHLRGVLDILKTAIDFHPILKLWKRKPIRTTPSYSIEGKNGWLLEGINMNLSSSKNPGHQFFQKHVKKLWIEEASFETEDVFNKRKESLSEVGAVLRLSGMTNFTRHMPAGKAFYDLSNQNKIVNLPQFVNPFWDEKEKHDRIKQYGGEDTLGYRIFVKGEVVEEGVSEFDMDRVRACYMKKKEIKKFEISKSRFKYFRNLIVVERPKNIDRIFVCADIGESAGTEIIVVGEIGNKYTYLYNITLYSLIHDEQLEVFKYLIEKLQANVIGVDCGDALGRTLADDFEKLYSKENVVRYAGATKIDVEFEKTVDGKVLLKNGKPVYRQEFMSEWSVRRLQALLYHTRIIIPIDYKFDRQINSVVSKVSGTRTVYHCLSESDHMFDAWRVFSIAQWLKKDFNQTKPVRKEGGVGTFEGKK